MAKKIEKEIKEKDPIQTPLHDLMNEWGLDYSWNVITDRALFSAGEGLKPSGLRTLYGLYKMGSKPDGKFIKVARVAGEIIGKYHPHAPASVEGVIGGFAQPFVSRVPLIDYQGSVGTSTGDKTASSRYWECGLNKAAWELIKDIKDNACEWTYTESGEDIIPVALPVGWPIGIINGGSGIAVGFASSIAPHNPDEVMDACIAFVNKKIKKPEDVKNYILGPDFPTGGLIINDTNYMVDGSGSIVIRGKYHTEELGRGRTAIVFTELPYQVSVEQVMTSITKQQEKGKFSAITEMKDLTDSKLQTDKSEVALTIYVKAGTDIKILINELFKNTPCESKFAVNSTVLIDWVPIQNVSLYTMISKFIEQKIKAYKLKKNHRLDFLNKELHKTLGLLAITLDIDKAINIIRNAKDENDAGNKLIKQFKIDDIQANYVLNMQLRKLTKQDKLELQKKQKEIETEINLINSILENEKLLNKEIIKELQETKKIISSPRRSEISDMTLEDLEAKSKKLEKKKEELQNSETCFVVTLENGNLLKKSVKDDKLKNWEVPVLSKLIGITKHGELIEKSVSDLPIKGNGYELENEVLALGLDRVINDSIGMLIVTSSGGVNIINDKLKSMPVGVKLKNDESVIFAKWLDKSDFESGHLIMIENGDGKLLRMPISEIRTSASGAGTIAGMKSKEGIITSAIVVKSNSEDYVYLENENQHKLVKISDIPLQSRGGQGSRIATLRKGQNWLTKLTLVKDLKKININPSARGSSMENK